MANFRNGISTPSAHPLRGISPRPSAPPAPVLRKPEDLFAQRPAESPTQDAPPRTLAAPSAGTSLNFVQSPRLGPDDRVLHIGDSHTVGIYGQEMDKHLRSTGAQVETYGSAGSSPHWWISGRNTRSGFFGRNAAEETTRPARWNDPHPTPKLKELLERFRPNVVMFSLGANMIHNSAENIEQQMRQIADMAKSYGTDIIWVGPPDGRESKKSTANQNRLYQTLERVAQNYGDFIDSRPLTEYPATGGDGVHYGGKEGSRRAKAWAESVFEQIQGSTP